MINSLQKYMLIALSIGCISMTVNALDTEDVKGKLASAASAVKDTVSSAAEKVGVDMVKARASYAKCIATCLKDAHRTECEQACLIQAYAERVKELEAELAKVKAEAKK